jgi:hypothetical protein
MPKPKKRRNHLFRRIRERIGTQVCQTDIEKNLDHNKIKFAKKVSHSRSIGYIIINDIPIKIVYSKTCKKAITVLPIHYDFCYPKNEEWFEYLHPENNNAYRIRIYPDAYLEADNPRSLTEFEIWNNTEMKWLPKKKIGGTFNFVFHLAWQYYEQTKKISANTI